MFEERSTEKTSFAPLLQFVFVLFLHNLAIMAGRGTVSLLVLSLLTALYWWADANVVSIAPTEDAEA